MPELKSRPKAVTRPAVRAGLPTGLVALDTETTGLDHYHGARAYFVTVCDLDGNQCSWGGPDNEWPVDPLTRRPQVPETDLDEIAEVLSPNQAGEIVGQNIKFDVHALSMLRPEFGEYWRWECTHECLLAAHPLGSNLPKDLTALAMQYLGHPIQPFEDRLEAAVKECRRRVQQARLKKKRAAEKALKDGPGLFAGVDDYPGGTDEPRPDVTDIALWRIAEEGLPDMPSMKSGGKDRDHKGWKADAWLPRAFRRYGLAPDRPEYDTVLSEYANTDSAVTVAVWNALRAEVKRRGLEEIYECRRRLLRVVWEMERRGVTKSVERTRELKEQYQESAERSHAVCVGLSDGRLTSLPVNGVSNALRDTIRNGLGLRSRKLTDKGNESLDQYVLDDWMITLEKGSPQHTFVKHLRAYRKRKTALGYIDSYEKFRVELRNETGEATGWAKLYMSLNPTATDTLRFTMSNPNGQQISKKEIAEEGQEGHNARHMFGPEDGREWYSMDYENIELRIPAYRAPEPLMIGLFERPDAPPYYGSNHLLFAHLIHDRNCRCDGCRDTVVGGVRLGLFEYAGRGYAAPARDRAKVAAHLATVLGGLDGRLFKDAYPDTWYQWTKNGDFAVQYSAVAESGTADRAYHVHGAQLKIEDRLSNVKRLNQDAVRFANKHGYVETLPDRTLNCKRGYPLNCTRTAYGKVKPTLPLSYMIQGTAMWCTIKAMLRCDEFFGRLNRGEAWSGRRWPGGYYMTLQVHDEIVFDFPALGVDGNLPVVAECKRLMEASGDDIGVPLKTSVVYNPQTWGKGVKVKTLAA